MRALLLVALVGLSSTAAAQAPDFYCTASTSFHGCVAQLSSTDPLAQPQSGAADYFVTATGIHGFKNGILFLGINGKAAIPFSGGTLCMLPPLGRGPIQNSGGSVPLTCDGAYTQLINDAGATHPNLDRGPGTSNWLQFWGRDACGGCTGGASFTSSAIEVVYQ